MSGKWQPSCLRLNVLAAPVLVYCHAWWSTLTELSPTHPPKGAQMLNLFSQCGMWIIVYINSNLWSSILNSLFSNSTLIFASHTNLTWECTSHNTNLLANFLSFHFFLASLSRVKQLSHLPSLPLSQRPASLCHNLPAWQHHPVTHLHCRVIYSQPLIALVLVLGVL